eukprot:s3118_g6.t1
MAVELWRRIAANEVPPSDIAAEAPRLLAALHDAEVDQLPSLLGCLAACCADRLTLPGAELQVASLLLQPPVPSILTPAALCVETLAVDPQSREVFRRSGAIRVLVAALGQSDSPESVEAATAALNSLSVDEECQAEMAALGALELLVSKLSVKAAECLGQFALKEAYRIRLYNLGLVAALLKLIEASPAVGAVAALLNLCALDDCKAAVCRVSGALRLLSSLLFGAAPLNQVAAMTLSSLAEKDSCACALTDSNCDLALLHCLSSDDGILVAKASEALLKLTLVPLCRSVLWQEERLKRLLAPKRPETQRHQLMILQHLAEEAKGRRALMKAGVLHFIRPLLDSSEANEAAAVAWNLSIEEAFVEELCHAGGVPILLENAGRSYQALGALLQMSLRNEEVIKQLYQQDAVQLLLDLLQAEADDRRIALYSAKLLTSMALEMDKFEQAPWRSAPNILALQLQRGVSRADGELLAELCGCCWLLCGNLEVHCNSFAEAGGLWAICIMLAEDEGPTEPALGILTALCRNREDRQESFLQMGGLELLLPFLHHSSPQRIRHLAAKAVCAVLEDQNLRMRRLAELGVLEVVSEILATFGENVQKF